MEEQRPFVLSIAGLDPSGGAGLLSDAKTFEQIGVQGLGVATALTFQNDKSFVDVDWVGGKTLRAQLDPLFIAYPITHVKIGLIKSLDALEKLIAYLVLKNENIEILWDPILSASAGYTFHDDLSKKRVAKILQVISMVTPNQPEALALSKAKDTEKAARRFAELTRVVIKGGHAIDPKTGFSDDLYADQFQSKSLRATRIENGEKHGSGCVFSAALIAYRAQGLEWLDATRKAKQYVTKYLKSTETLLGKHK